jgi:guanylate kinase
MSEKQVAVILHGPGGVGKDTIVSMLKMQRPISTTDRKPRRRRNGKGHNERDGVDYYFVHPQMFTAMVESSAFVEHANVLGYRKGIVRGAVDEAIASGWDFLIRTDIQGAKTWREKLIGCVSILVLGCDPAEPYERHADDLRRRLESRGAPQREIELRMEELLAEHADVANNDYTVINPWNRSEDAVERIREIIEAERNNPDRPAPRLLA